MKQKIFVIEDERDINELVRFNLQREGFNVSSFFDGLKAIKAMSDNRPDLIILDLMLPEVDGLELCQILKNDEKTKNIPIIMLTAKSEDSDVVVGLQLGADDYITKPFSPQILIARVKAIFRRIKQNDLVKDEVRIFGNLTVDFIKHKVLVANQPVKLTMIEFAILEFLSRSPGRVFTRDQILDNVWKDGKFIVDRAVDVHIRGLRKQLGQGADWIETVRGIGYRFKENE